MKNYYKSGHLIVLKCEGAVMFIPEWVLWSIAVVVGVPLTVFVLFCAWIGYGFIKSFKLNW